MRILIVEDEPTVARAIEAGLLGEGYAVTVAHSGEDAFFLVNTQLFDLMVLDLMLPGRDGLDILRALRSRGHGTPVLILSARDAVEDRVLGLETGADDYLVKPFAFSELLARIRALVRRGRPDEVLRLQAADLELDLVTRGVRRSGVPLELTAKEFELLEFLLRNQGQAVSRETISREVWHEVQRATPLDNVIDVHIARLRKKVDTGHAIRLIQTLRGVGFMLKPEGM